MSTGKYFSFAPTITMNSTLALTPDNNILVDGQPITIGDYIGLFYNNDELQYC